MIFKNLQRTFSCAFGVSKTGKTVTVSVINSSGVPVVTGFTAGSVVELGDGCYGVAITFTSNFSGYLKWNNTTDAITLYEPILVIDDYSLTIEVLRKIETNRWEVDDNQLTIYNDDGVTPLYVFDLHKEGSPNGEEPDERIPA